MHCHTLLYSFYILWLYVNFVEVTVNTCTCTDLFTVITTKDQSGGIYDSYSTGGQGFMPAVSEQTMSSSYDLRLTLFTAINLCYRTITQLTSRVGEIKNMCIQIGCGLASCSSWFPV